MSENGAMSERSERSKVRGRIRELMRERNDCVSVMWLIWFADK